MLLLPAYTTFPLPRNSPPRTLPSILASAPPRPLYVCSETSDYRLLARHLPQITPASLTVEIGCSYGVASLILARRGGTVVGVDVAEEPLFRARERCAAFGGEASSFHAVDVLRDSAGLLPLLPPTPSGGAVLFVDIGGEGLLHLVHSFLESPFVTSLDPLAIVVKNRALWKSAVAAERAGAVSGEVTVHDNRRYRRTAEAAEAGGGAASLGYALDQTPRLAPGSETLFICRFQNFYEKGCTRKTCEYDHEHCYLCGKKGHRAVDGKGASCGELWEEGVGEAAGACSGED